MATFITTIKFTQKGLEAISESPKRVATFKAAGKKMGIKVTGAYWTTGYFDGVMIFHAGRAFYPATNVDRVGRHRRDRSTNILRV